MKVCIVGSTNGSVMNALFGVQYFRNQVQSFVTDRECEALNTARRHDVPAAIFSGKDNAAFSDCLLRHLLEIGIDYVVSFFTRLYTGNLLSEYRNRLINPHLSLLPAFNGFNSFQRAIVHGARFIGGTIHFIDPSTDGGSIILQHVYPAGPDDDVGILRHRIFVQQCQALLQVTKWLDEDRIAVDGRRVVVSGADYNSLIFSPALDFTPARTFDIRCK